VGSKVSKLRQGDAVLGTVSMKRSGAFAGRLITAESLVVPKPANLSFVEAACLPIAGVTAWQALVKAAKLERGERLFINGAMGAVGRAAIAISQLIGADATGRVGTGSLAQGRALGLAATLDYAKPLPASLDGSFDVVFDCNGSLSIRQAARILKPGGVIVDIAPTSSKFLCGLLSRSRKTLFADLGEDNLLEVVGLAAAGKLAIPVARTLRLEEAPGLLASLERGERLDGKAVITFAE
jgi:NADPH:quinone reductase-like Zn-dependent oxidoreductase